jgi:hypothetical protein
MIRKSPSILFLATALFSFQPEAVANTYDVVVKGKVAMEGNAPAICGRC